MKNVFIPPEWLEYLSKFAWVASNLLIAYIALALIAFVSAYYVLFDPRATTAGKFVFRFALSLVGVIGLVFVGVFVDPQPGRTWSDYAGDMLWWRPFLRLIVYGYVAFTITGLAVLLWIRKWRPDYLRTSIDRDLVKPRSDSKPTFVLKKKEITDEHSERNAES